MSKEIFNLEFPKRSFTVSPKMGTMYMSTENVFGHSKKNK